MFIAALLTLARTWKQLKCPSSKWINKIKYCSGLKRKGILIYASMWKNPEYIILSKISHTV
jgi:hypothetical protein